ncbi:fibronectin type III domain-containing protein [Candidatus Dojkabacteria bacterium]|jgi:hypothetical protein|nr:fibronectin type III domain-containing protein [Candidatus Dojkabacteria bacterium]
MRKIFKNILPVLFILPLIFGSMPTKDASAFVYSADQYCDNANIEAADAYYLIKIHNTLAQTFRPHKNRFTSLLLALAGGADVNAVVTANVYIGGGEGLAVSKTETTQTAQVTWVEFTFPAPISVDTTKEYLIEISTPSDTARWIVSNVPCYSDGKALVEGAYQDNQDFGFVTRGYNVASTPDPVVPETIAKPTALKAQYFSDEDRVKLTWTKSTTSGVDGYKIYRSTSKNSGYSKIAEVDGDISKFNDYSVTPHTYYYYIKATKGDLKSPSSSKASVVVTVPSVKNTTGTDTAQTGSTSDLIDAIKNDTNENSEDIATFMSKLMGPYIPFTFAIVGCVVIGIIIVIVIIASKGKAKKTGK